jgi:anti-sigma factor RsiW
MVDLVRGHLPAIEQQSIHSHTAACAQCAAQMARVERLVAETRADDSQEVPTHVVARAVRLMRQRKAAAQPALRRRIAAVVRFDSARTPLALGRRSQPSSGRQVVFDTGLHDVVVRLKPAGDRCAVWGQVLGSVAGGQVTLEGPASAQTELNSLSEFSLPPVPPGAYALTLQLDDVEIDMALDITV